MRPADDWPAFLGILCILFTCLLHPVASYNIVSIQGQSQERLEPQANIKCPSRSAFFKVVFLRELFPPDQRQAIASARGWERRFHHNSVHSFFLLFFFPYV